MKFTPEVQAALQTLKDNAENDFERHRIAVLEKDLTAPPTVEVIDDTHQKFNGVVYRSNKDGHFVSSTFIHRSVYSYCFSEIPCGNYEVHHIDQNKANNDISNLQLLTKSEHQKLHKGINMEKRLRICPTCGETFLAKHGNPKQIYCSNNCRGKAMRKPISKNICPVCGKNFIVPITRPNKICCSNDCAAIYRIENMPNIETTCAFCGKKINTKSPEKKYCSKSCQLKAFRKKNKTLIEKICPVCGKKFIATRNDKIYCSKKCCCKINFKKRQAKRKNITSPAATTSPLNHSAD